MFGTARGGQVQVLGRRRRGHVGVVLHRRPARDGAFLGLDQDHAVRGAAAVDRGRRASFSTVIDAMSEGLSKFKGLRGSGGVLPRR